MNRRHFLQALGVFTASAILPLEAAARIAESAKFGEGTFFALFRCAPLNAGHHTVSWFCDRGLAVFGVTALGGEEYIKVWADHDPTIRTPMLSEEGVHLTFPEIYERLKIDLREPHARLTRGAEIFPIDKANWWSGK